jgi:uncharacterized damage-inducible protein DinB
MSQLKELLLAQTGYSGWATLQLLDACSTLSLEQIDRDLGASHTSILRTLRHIHDGERVWLRRLVEVDNEHLPPGPAPTHSFESLAESWPELWDGCRRWIESATEDDLICEVTTLMPDSIFATPPRSTCLRVPRWQIVLHAVNHSTFHRGQIVTMLRDLGVQPPTTELTFYCLNR